MDSNAMNDKVKDMSETKMQCWCGVLQFLKKCIARIFRQNAIAKNIAHIFD